MSLAQKMDVFKGHIPNDHHHACLSNKSIPY